MAYDRYDERRRYRDPRSRQFGDDRDERGFFERARDEVSSWFGDEEAERRRDRDERFESRWDEDRFPSRDRGQFSSRDRDYDRFERSARWRDEGYRRPYTGRFSSRNDFGSDNRYRPMTGDYGRSSDFEREAGFDRSSFGDNMDRGQSQRDFTGAASGLHDRDYSSWRRRQIDDLDRDYDEFRRENSSRFETEFGTWRQSREAKKQMTSQLTEHMEVVGSDNEPVGKIDHIKSDRVILTKSDSPDGRHHVIGCSRFDRVEDGKLILDQPASQIQQMFEKQQRSRALFEDERPDDNGPHMLNRSFSGTY